MARTLGTIVIPAYNCAATLVRALTSVFAAIARYRDARGSGDFAIAVVDDGSTDATAAIARDWAARHPDLALLSLPGNFGPGAARNAGARAAIGEYLFYLDGDDEFLPDHLLECADGLDRLAEAGFVKTGVAIDAPGALHPAWRESIANSIVINLAVRRACHEFIEGFFDEPPFRALHAEDALYSGLLMTFFTQLRRPKVTVRHYRFPGNAFDRQRAKFEADPAQAIDSMTPAERAAYPEVTALYEARRQRLVAKMALPWSGPPFNEAGPRTILIQEGD
ncbi:MAG: glycosyltransferase family 2 protein [Rhodospirillales bacterium]|nr:glycosyltransferase family 2 protein [Rhodospirillales bacterium]